MFVEETKPGASCVVLGGDVVPRGVSVDPLGAGGVLWVGFGGGSVVFLFFCLFLFSSCTAG